MPHVKVPKKRGEGGGGGGEGGGTHVSKVRVEGSIIRRTAGTELSEDSDKGRDSVSKGRYGCHNLWPKNSIVHLDVCATYGRVVSK